MNTLQEVTNVAGFLLENSILVGGIPRLKYLHGSVNGNWRPRLIQSVADWHIQDIEGLNQLTWECTEITTLCDIWRNYARKNFEFYTALDNTVNNAAHPAVLVAMNQLQAFYNLNDHAETICAYVNHISQGAQYMKIKINFATNLRDAAAHFEVASRSIKDVERNLAVKVLTPREAAEKAKEIIQADSNLNVSAQLFYNKKAADGEEETGVRTIIGTQTPTRASTLSWITIMNGVNAGNPASLMYYLEGSIDLNVIETIRTQRDRNQPSIIKILDCETQHEDKEELEERKLSVFLEDLKDLYEKEKEKPVEDMEDVCEINELIDVVKHLEIEVRKLRENKANFTNTAIFGTRNVNIKEYLSSIKIELHQKKEDILEEKALQKEIKKSSQMEMQKALPRYEITPFKSMKDFVPWIFAVETILEKVEGCDEVRICQMVKNSIINKGDRRQIEGENDINQVIHYMKTKYVTCEDMIGSSLQHLLKLQDPETVSQALYNSQEISATLRKMENLGILDKIENTYLMILEMKAFEPKGRDTYILEKRIKLETKKALPKGKPLKASTPKPVGEKEKGSSSLVEELNLSGTIREALSVDKVGESVKMFSDHLITYISSCRYYLTQSKALQRMTGKGPKSPRNRRKPQADPTESNQRILKTSEKGDKNFKIPLKKCPLGCEEDIKFGSLEFCTKFEQREKPERKKIVQAKFICKKCLKPKRVHERNNGICKAPACRTCGAGHHIMLCEAVQDKKQMLKTGEKDDEDENSEDSESEDDEDHIRYLQEAYGQNDSNNENQQEGQEKSSDEETDSAALLSEEDLSINLRKMSVPVEKKDNKIDEWWKQVCEVHMNGENTKTNPIESSSVVTGIKNIRLLGVVGEELTVSDQEGKSKENFQEEDDTLCKVNKVQRKLEDRDGEIEHQLLEDLFSVKHKWKNRNEAEDFKKKYESNSQIDDELSKKQDKEYISIDRLCENKLLFDTLLKLSTLMFMKYNHTRGIIVKAKIKVKNLNFIDKDIKLLEDEEQGYMEGNLCIDTGADLVCGQHDFLESNDFERISDQDLTIVTVFGPQKQSFRRKKLKILRNDGKLENICALDIPEIGHERRMSKEFISSILKHYGTRFDPNILNKIDTETHGKIHLLIGANLTHGEKLNSEQVGLPFHPAIHPNFNFFWTPFNSKILMFGHLGVDPSLVDDDFPVFKVHKSVFLPEKVESTTTSLQYSEVDDTLLITDPTVDAAELSNICGKVLLARSDLEELAKYIQSEGEPQFHKLCIGCMRHSRRCDECRKENNKLSLEEKKLLQTMWENTNVKIIDGQERIFCKVTYKRPPEITFSPANSNIVSATTAARRVVKSLANRKGELDEYTAQIKKAVDQGTLKRLSPEEVENLSNTPHFCTHHGVVYKPDSISSSVRLINNTSVLVKGAATNLSIECPPVTKYLNSMVDCIVHFLLYDIPLCADLKSAYRQLVVDEITSRLRILVYFEDPPVCSKPIYYLRSTFDFGDSVAGVFLEIAERKVVAGRCSLPDTIALIKDRRYVDNLNDSYRLPVYYHLVKEEMVRVHESVHLPVKEVLTTTKVEPDVIEKNNRPDSKVITMGLTWDMVSDSITPNIYLTRFPKRRGKPLGTSLFLDQEIDVTDINRLVLSRLVPQLYDPLGNHLGPLKAQGKMLLSRACQIASTSHMETPLISLDESFGKQCYDWILDLKKLRELKPHQRALIRGDEKLWGLTAHTDGGSAGFGTSIFVSVHDAPESDSLKHRILGSKSRVSRRSIPCHEALSKPLGLEVMLSLAKPLSTRDEFEDASLTFVVANDSVCTALLFKPGLMIRNMLLKNCVDAAIRTALDFNGLFPLCTVVFTWIPGAINCADPLTKILPNPIGICNSKEWRQGYSKMESKKEILKYTYLTVSEHQVQYHGLPESITNIAHNSANLAQVSPNENFDKTATPETFNVRCTICGHGENSCGILLTRSQIKDLNEIKDKISTDITKVDDATQASNKGISAQEMLLLQKYQLTDCNLFQPEKYKGFKTPMTKDFYLEMLNNNSHLLPFFFTFVHIVCWFTNSTSKMSEEILCKAWEKILITSQHHFPPKHLKQSETVVNGIRCSSFRLDAADSEQIFGTTHLPLISQDDPLFWKILKHAHVPPSSARYSIHDNAIGTKANVSRGPFGITCANLQRLIENLLETCFSCMIPAEITYTPPMGNCTTGLLFDKQVFSEISIDPIGGIKILPFAGARRGFDIFPLVVACKSTCAIEVIFMEATKTKNILLGLLQLEAKYNNIKKICCDAGSNLINIGNEVKPTNMSPAEQTILKKLETVKQHLPNSQRRNYVERRIQTLKRYIKVAFRTPANNALPILSFQEVLTTFAIICRRINSIPYKSPKNQSLVSPATFIHPSMKIANFDLHNCEHKFDNFNTSAVRVQKHIDAATQIRNDLLCDPKLYKNSDLKGAKRKSRTLKANIGDLVLVNPKGKYNAGHFGLIDSFSSEQTAVIRTKDGFESIAIANLYVILSEELRLKNIVSV